MKGLMQKNCRQCYLIRLHNSAGNIPRGNIKVLFQLNQYESSALEIVILVVVYDNNNSRLLSHWNKMNYFMVIHLHFQVLLISIKVYNHNHVHLECLQSISCVARAEQEDHFAEQGKRDI